MRKDQFNEIWLPSVNQLQQSIQHIMVLMAKTDLWNGFLIMYEAKVIHFLNLKNFFSYL